MQTLTPHELHLLSPTVHKALVTAYAYALPPIFLALVPVLAAAFVLSFFLKEKKLRTTVGPEDAAAPADGAAAEATPADTAAQANGTPLAPLLAMPNGNGQSNGHTNGNGQGVSAPALAAVGAIPAQAAGRSGNTGRPGAADGAAGGPAGGDRRRPGTAPVQGYVRQPDGMALAGATVTLIDPACGRRPGPAAATTAGIRWPRRRQARTR